MDASAVNEQGDGSNSTRRSSSGNLAIKTFLVPLDGSDNAMRAMPVAVEFAKELDADVVLIAAKLPASPDPPPRASLERVAAAYGPTVTHVEIVSSVELADALGAIASAKQGSVVCMATHARAAMSRAWFGSYAELVLEDLSLPVILVGPRCDRRWQPRGPIVAGLDGSLAALEALASAIDWSRALDVGLSVVHVAHPLDSDLAPDRVLEAAVKQHPDADFDVCVLRSREPEWEIVDHARRLDASLVVCSTHGRTGLSRMLMGSVAGAIVRRAVCPALLHRPMSMSPDEDATSAGPAPSP